MEEPKCYTSLIRTNYKKEGELKTIDDLQLLSIAIKCTQMDIEKNPQLFARLLYNRFIEDFRLEMLKHYKAIRDKRNSVVPYERDDTQNSVRWGAMEFIEMFTNATAEELK